MNQPSLFEDVVLARATDPQTSKRAAREIESKLGDLAAKMLAVFQHREATAKEAARTCVGRYGGDEESYRKRSGELKRAGLIRLTGERHCTISGKLAQTFRKAD